MINITREEAKEYIGAGWSDLIDEIYNKLPDNAFILQIKEKFGGLRFYVDNISGEVQDFIWEVEDRSLGICEVCGKEGKPRDGGWIKTLCDEHSLSERQRRLNVQVHKG